MAETDFRIQESSIVRIHSEPTSVTAQGAPYYPRLNIPIELVIESISHPSKEVPQYVILNVQSELYTGNSDNNIADSTPIFDPLQFINNNKARTNYSLEFPLDSYRIKAIEEERRGNINLKVKLKLLVGHYKALSIQDEHGQSTQTFLTRYEKLSPSYDLALDIPQSHWVEKVLPLLGLGEYFIIEMPKGKKTLQEAWGYLEKAESAFRTWNEKDVFANCRELGASLEQAVKINFGEQDFSYKEKWGRSFKNFEHLLSLYLHMEEKRREYPSSSVSTAKADAEHVLIISKALIKYVEELVQQRG
ncbi:MAG: hypothetical protein ACR2LC_09220 [Pyrinomonadaceae bacterium]